MSPQHSPLKEIVWNIENYWGLLHPRLMIPFVLTFPDGADTVEGEADITHILISQIWLKISNALTI